MDDRLQVNSVLAARSKAEQSLRAPIRWRVDQRDDESPTGQLLPARHEEAPGMKQPAGTQVELPEPADEDNDRRQWPARCLHQQEGLTDTGASRHGHDLFVGALAVGGSVL
jgi:hypothetical protein